MKNQRKFLEVSSNDDNYTIPEFASSILPAWFVDRMMTDEWHFGLMLDTGKILGISSIRRVYSAANGSIWIDATLLEHNPVQAEIFRDDIITSPTSRTGVTVNAAHIVAAFELADT